MKGLNEGRHIFFEPINSFMNSIFMVLHYYKYFWDLILSVCG